MPKYLAIDYGLERTGLAVSDPDGKIAFPLNAIRLKNYPNRGAALDALAKIADDEKADALIIGLPLRADGGETPFSKIVRNASERIKRRVSAPIYFMPEYLSTREARSQLALARPKKKTPREMVDSRAACLILESFLNLPESGRRPL